MNKKEKECHNDDKEFTIKHLQEEYKDFTNDIIPLCMDCEYYDFGQTITGKEYRCMYTSELIDKNEVCCDDMRKYVIRNFLRIKE